MQILCSKALGRGDLRESNGNFSLAVTTALTLMISLMGATFLFTGQLADILGAGESLGVIRSLTVDYLQAFSLSLPALALVTVLTPIMQLDSDRNRAVFATVVLSVSDIVADLVSVFVFDGGLWGIGLATAVSYWIAAGVLLLHFVKPNASFAYLPEAMHVKSLREMFLAGMTMIIGRGSSVLTVSILTRISLAILPCALSLLSNYYAARKFRLATVTTILNKLVVFAVTSSLWANNVSARRLSAVARRLDNRRSMFVGICIEEIAGNIVDYGFGDGKKHFVDVRIIVNGEQIIIRLRDDC